MSNHGGRLAISLGSINTGLPKDIVQQIIAAEKAPIKNMENQKERFTNKMKLLNQLINLMRELQTELTKNQTLQGFRELKATFDTDLIDVTTDKNIAQTGAHQIEVLQLAQKSSAMSNGLEDPDEVYLGVGFFSYGPPDGTEKEIYIDSKNSSLRGLAKLINNSSDKMVARVINDGSDDDTPWRLLISFTESGDKNKITFPNFYLIDGEEDFSLESQRMAQDAKIKLDGFEIETSSNKIEDLIPGVTIELKKAVKGKEFTLNIAEDIEKTSDKVSIFVDQLNAILKFINNQNSIDAKTDTSKTLGGDITLTTFESQLRSIIFKSYPTRSGSLRLGDLGATFQRDGLLNFNQDTFESALSSNFSAVSEMLNGIPQENGSKTDGLVRDLSRTLDFSLRLPDGVITGRKKGIQNRIDGIDDQIEQRQRIIDRKEKISRIDLQN